MLMIINDNNYHQAIANFNQKIKLNFTSLNSFPSSKAIKLKDKSFMIIITIINECFKNQLKDSTKN